VSGFWLNYWKIKSGHFATAYIYKKSAIADEPCSRCATSLLKLSNDAKLYEKNHILLDGCIVLNERNTVFAPNRSAICNRYFLGPPKSWTQTVSRSLPIFLQGLLGDRPTDKPTDHATRSFTMGGIYLRIKVKERKGNKRRSIHIEPFVYYVYLKRSGMDHTFTCK